MTISDLSYLEAISEGTSLTVSRGGIKYTYTNYTVKPGDTLSGITYSYYGDGTAPCYNDVAYYNYIPNPNLIYAGEKITLPPTSVVPGCY